jgi:hypothetical protein
MTWREISTRFGAWIAAAMAATGAFAQSAPFTSEPSESPGRSRPAHQAPRVPSWLVDRFGGNENDFGGSLVRTEGSGVIDEDRVKTAREVISHSRDPKTDQIIETPMWTNPRGFEKDVFTFARAIFKVGPNTDPGYGFRKRLGWWVDFPDADLNLSYRLQQMTSMRTDPDGRVLKLNDPELRNYPFLLMEHPGYIMLREDEVLGLRKYLHAGGTLAVIDFWNAREWQGFAEQMKRVLPGSTWVELGMDHQIFHCVFDLKGPMQRLQVPTMQFWNTMHDPDNPASSVHRADFFRGEGSDRMSVRAIYNEKGHMMVIAFHNSDITDGWEREGEHQEFFEVFSERVSYPLGVNLIVYLMTH